MDKISVIIPVRNEEDKIARCFEAVFNQTIKSHEVIVVDGESTDKIDVDCIPEQNRLENLRKEFDDGIVAVDGKARGELS